MRGKQFILFGLLLFVGMFSLGNYAQAESFGFSVHVNQPKEQIDKTLPYLDLRLKPSETTNISVKVRNDSKKKSLNLETNFASAKTNSEGIVEYAPYDMPEDKSLKYDFKQLVKGPKEITLKPSEEREVTFQITMPDDEIDGFIAGGIELKQIEKSSPKNMLSTEFSYIIGLRMSQNDKKIPAEIEYRKILTGYRDSRPTIMTYLSNVTSDYIENLEITVNVRKKDSNTILLSSTKEGMRMAPNSMILFPILIDNKALNTGKYEALISVKTEDGYTKDWTKPFLLKVDRDGKLEVGQTKETKEHVNLKWLIVLVFVFPILVWRILKIKKQGVNK